MITFKVARRRAYTTGNKSLPEVWDNLKKSDKNSNENSNKLPTYTQTTKNDEQIQYLKEEKVKEEKQDHLETKINKK